MFRQMTKTGWANLCRTHYEHHHLAEIVATCDRMKLTTTAQLRKHCRKFSREVMKRPSKEWAVKLLAAKDRGEHVPFLSETFARTALVWHTSPGPLPEPEPMDDEPEIDDGMVAF